MRRAVWMSETGSVTRLRAIPARGKLHACARLPDGELTLLFTDIDGSTRLVQKYGDRYPDVLAEHRGVLRQAFARHGGVEVDTQGDAFFVVFATSRRRGVGGRGGATGSWPAARCACAWGCTPGRPCARPRGTRASTCTAPPVSRAAGHGGQVLLSAVVGRRGRRAVRAARSGRAPAQGSSGTRSGSSRFGGTGLAFDFPPLRSAQQHQPTRYPGGALVGRERELAELASAIRSGRSRVVTLTGAGGTGKTRLAVQAGLELVEHFPNGVLFVGLAPLTDARLVIPAIAQTVGVRESPGEPLLETLAAHLRDAAAAAHPRQLRARRRCGRRRGRAGRPAPAVLRVLATSREPLRHRC